MKQALHVKRNPERFLLRWLSVEVNAESRLPEPESFSRGSPSLQTAPSPRLSPQAEKEREREGCLHALPGGWTDGKELAR